MHEYFYGMYASDDSEEFLEHHGILGMKWGIRRFQNEDGSLKAAGKKRRAEERVQKRAERKAAKAEKKAAEAEEAKKKLRAEIDDAIANVDFEKLSKLKGQMTDADLKRIADRAGDLGRTARQLNDYKKGLPSSAFEKAVDTLHAVSKGLDAIRGAHASYYDLKKEFGIDRKSLMESLKDDGDSGSKSDDGPDIFDRIKDLTTNIAKDAASKASEKYQEKKRDEKAKAAISEFMDNIDKSGPKPSQSSNSDVDIPKPSLPWSTPAKSVPNPSQSSNSDVDAPKPSLPGSTPVKSVPKPSQETRRNIERIMNKAGDTSVDDLNADLLRRNGQKLGL